MKTYRTSALCPKCGSELRTSDIAGYPFVCATCNENFFAVEVKGSSNGDYGLEFSVPVSLADAENALSFANHLLKDADFIAYDDVVKSLDIGYKKMAYGNELLQIVHAIRKIGRI